MHDLDWTDMSTIVPEIDLDTNHSNCDGRNSGSSTMSLQNHSRERIAETPALSSDFELGEEFWDSTTDLAVANSTIPMQTRSHHCACLALATSVCKSSDMHLTRLSREQTVTIVGVLQKQKKTVSECALILNCRQCTTQVYFVLLLITLSDKIVGSFESVTQDIQNSKRRESISLELHSHYEGVAPRHAMSYVARQLLDENDHRAVLISLVQTRSAELLRMILRIEKVCLKQGWPDYAMLTRALVHRCRMIEDNLPRGHKGDEDEV